MTRSIPPNPNLVPIKDKTKHTSKIPPWRITWIGIGLAIMLWFGSSIYFKKMHDFSTIQYQGNEINTSQYDATIRRNARYSMACKIGAGVLCLASFLFLISQADIHRPRNNT